MDLLAREDGRWTPEHPTECHLWTHQRDNQQRSFLDCLSWALWNFNHALVSIRDATHSQSVLHSSFSIIKDKQWLLPFDISIKLCLDLCLCLCHRMVHLRCYCRSWPTFQYHSHALVSTRCSYSWAEEVCWFPSCTWYLRKRITRLRTILGRDLFSINLPDDRSCWHSMAYLYIDQWEASPVRERIHQVPTTYLDWSSARQVCYSGGQSLQDLLISLLVECSWLSRVPRCRAPTRLQGRPLWLLNNAIQTQIDTLWCPMFGGQAR